jgi:hypothetical protein
MAMDDLQIDQAKKLRALCEAPVKKPKTNFEQICLAALACAGMLLDLQIAAKEADQAAARE